MWLLLAVFLMEKKSKAPEILRGFAFAKALFLKVVVNCPNVAAKANVPENFGKLIYTSKISCFLSYNLITAF